MDGSRVFCPPQSSPKGKHRISTSSPPKKNKAFFCLTVLWGTNCFAHISTMEFFTGREPTSGVSRGSSRVGSGGVRNRSLTGWVGSPKPDAAREKRPDPRKSPDFNAEKAVRCCCCMDESPRSPSHERFLERRSSPFMRPAERVTALRAWCKQRLSGW